MSSSIRVKILIFPLAEEQETEKHLNNGTMEGKRRNKAGRGLTVSSARESFAAWQDSGTIFSLILWITFFRCLRNEHLSPSFSFPDCKAKILRSIPIFIPPFPVLF